MDYLLAVGGGSVIDGSKFVAAAVPFAGEPLGGLIGVSGTIGSGTARVTLTDTYAAGVVSGAVTTLEYDDQNGYIDLEPLLVA
mgnify:CR=1 FL=1